MQTFYITDFIAITAHSHLLIVQAFEAWEGLHNPGYIHYSDFACRMVAIRSVP